MWKSTLDTVEPIEGLERLPSYGFLFFFKNMGRFKGIFCILTAVSITSTIFGFLAVYVLGEVISNVADLSVSQLFWFYLPAFLLFITGKEFLDYSTRRYGELFPAIYGEHLTLRFYRTVLSLNFQRLFNLSKEKLQILIGKYVGSVLTFLSGWFWGVSKKITNFVIILIVLYLQSPYVLAAGLLYMSCFLCISLRISRAFSPIAKKVSQQGIKTSYILQSFTLNLNTVKRLAIAPYFFTIYRLLTGLSWDLYEAEKKFHARRWLLQLNLFNLLYISSLFFGIYQVKIGTLRLGFLILIKYAFDQLWEVLVYIIEYYVSLIQQREDTKIITEEFRRIGSEPVKRVGFKLPSDWKRMSILDATVRFQSTLPNGKDFFLKIPKFEIIRGEKIGIVGANGTGKTTTLQVILNLIPFDGKYQLDGGDLRGCEFDPKSTTFISSSEPFFNVSINDNITLGRSVDQARLSLILSKLGIMDFALPLERSVGDPEVNFSTGQWQRLRLARGLLQDSEVYLLDEPLNGVDLEGKASILDFLAEYLKDKTVMLVTHNEEELRLVDKIYQIRENTLLLK